MAVDPNVECSTKKAEQMARYDEYIAEHKLYLAVCWGPVALSLAALKNMAGTDHLLAKLLFTVFFVSLVTAGLKTFANFYRIRRQKMKLLGVVIAGHYEARRVKLEKYMNAADFPLGGAVGFNNTFNILLVAGYSCGFALVLLTTWI